MRKVVFEVLGKVAEACLAKRAQMLCSPGEPVLQEPIRNPIAPVRDPASGLWLQMDASQRANAFCYAPEHPLWKAILDELALYRESCIQTAKRSDLTQRETDQALGGVSVLDDFQAELTTRMQESRKTEK